MVQTSRSYRIKDPLGILNRLNNHIVKLPHTEADKPDSLAIQYNLEKYLLK